MWASLSLHAVGVKLHALTLDESSFVLLVSGSLDCKSSAQPF